MNGTPRLPSAFPQTPTTIPRRRKLFETPSRAQPRDVRDPKSPSRSPAKVPKPLPNTNTPLVPTDVIDAPSQRLYVVAFYLGLNAYRIYESWNASDELDSTWLFLKWVSLDGIFLFGLQALRIPWLEWALPTTLALFLLHVVGNVFLMFRIPVRAAASFPKFDFGQPSNLQIDSFGRVARRPGQGSLRSRTVHIRAEGEAWGHYSQCLVDFGKANRAHFARRVSHEARSPICNRALPY